MGPGRARPLSVRDVVVPGAHTMVVGLEVGPGVQEPLRQFGMATVFGCQMERRLTSVRRRKLVGKRDTIGTEGEGQILRC